MSGNTLSPQQVPEQLGVVLVGYGNAGRFLHAPLIATTPGMSLCGVVSSQRDLVAADWPGVPVLQDLSQALDDEHAAVVVIATPNHTHYDLARQALLCGRHVVIDKPCAVTLKETHSLLALASQQGRVLTVFQNRRLDSDFLAVQKVLQSGVLGRVVEVESHFDRFRPQVPQRWRDQALAGAGLWFDLGAHLLDQALCLWGMPSTLYLDQAKVRCGALVDDWFHAVLGYQGESGDLRVILHASTLVAQLGPRWRVQGTSGSFTKYGLDTQEAALKMGLRPDADAASDWGADPSPGEVFRAMEIAGHQGPVFVRETVPSPPGNYGRFYAGLRDHLQHGQALLVPPDQVSAVMHLLELGQKSAATGQQCQVVPPDKSWADS